MNAPELFLEKMKELLGDEYEQYIKAMEETRFYGLRVNTTKISTEEFEKIAPFKLKKIPWINNGYFYCEEDQPAKHPYYYAGLYYLQEPSAMTPASRLPIKEGDYVLDLCAAPGGKATELASRLKGTGILVANDISSSRAKALLKNIELFGIKNAFVVTESPDKLARVFGGYFDKILIDAPCSGEGMFRKDKNLIKEWVEKGPSYYSKLQKEIITQAASMLKPGGMMLYSTCTFSESENEEVIDYLLEQDPSFEVIPMEGYEGFSKGRRTICDGVRIFPHKMDGEGHFLSLLKKKEQVNFENCKQSKLTESKNMSFLQFAQGVSAEWFSTKVTRIQDKVYAIPDNMPSMKGLRFLRTGLLLGELKKERFEPSQALAMALKAHEYKYCIKFEIQDERVIRYLKGETIYLDVEPVKSKSGWYLVCVNDYPLGWAKTNGLMLKNKYYPGWRWNESHKM